MSELKAPSLNSLLDSDGADSLLAESLQLEPEEVNIFLSFNKEK